MPLSSEQLIEGLVQEATAATIAEQRLRQRLPFFRPASITLDDAESTEFPGFTRDISSGGVGLLHQTPLDKETVNVGIWTVTGRRDDICIKIRWCNSVGQGWYVSGGQFTGLSVQQSVSLLRNRSRAGAMNLQIALDLAPRFRPQCSYEQCAVEDSSATRSRASS
jgi:hypothetical protein